MATNAKMLLHMGLLAALLVVMPARATSIQIDIDTSLLGLSGQNWDLAFDFFDGDGDPQSNTATISNFVISGGSLNRSPGSPYPILSGDATGDLSTAPPPVVLRDSSFTEYFDNADLGSLITFVLEITDNSVSGLTPDAFSFLILDPTTGVPPFSTSDPTGANALVVYSIGNDNQPDVFCPQDTDCVTVTAVPVVGVPEPGVLSLAIAALLALGFALAVRKAPSRGALTA